MLKKLLIPALLLAVVLAYANTFRVPVVLDDVAGIAENASIEHLATSLAPPENSSLTGRPLVNVTLALNYAIGGRALWSYHLGNLALHLISTLALFALVRRTLELRGETTHACSIAFFAAALWALHPLQTASVTYLMQRTELLVSACYLLTLYCFVRDWRPASIFFCALGMASKEVMVTAPLVVWLYDRVFLAGTTRRPRGIYYLLLASTWAILLAFVFGTENRGGSAGFATPVPWYAYAGTQLWAIPHYLRLALWPAPLVFDYGTTLVHSSVAIALGAGVVAALVATSILALRRWPAAGFCGAWFFLLLAPTSSVVPIATQVMAEHRLYLALAAPLVLGVVGLHRWLEHRAWLVGVPVALALGVATFQRNQVYRSATTLWADVIAKQPDNARAHYNLGLGLLEARDFAAAEREFRAAIALEPESPRARHKLSTTLLEAGRAAEALPYLQEAVRVRRSSALAYYDLARALLALGRPEETPRLLTEAIRLAPENAAAHYELGNAYVALGRTPEALAPLQAAVRLNPAHAAAHYNLGHVFAQLGRYPEALAEFAAAAKLDPNDAAAKNNAERIRSYLNR